MLVLVQAVEKARDSVFDTTWHYDWSRLHEPSAPCLFVYSVVDRTTRQDAIERWMSSNKDR